MLLKGFVEVVLSNKNNKSAQNGKSDDINSPKGSLNDSLFDGVGDENALDEVEIEVVTYSSEARDEGSDDKGEPSTSPGRVGDSQGDDTLDETVRPKSFAEIVGRAPEKEMLTMMIDAAKKRGDVIDHILFYGPPGLGKTTFAVSISNEVGASLKITSGPAIERQGDLAAILTNLRHNDILFIDEIHRLNRSIEEVLYPAMEDGAIDIIMGKGPSAKTIRLNLEPFTLIGATTQIGRISSPMRERFGLVQRLDYFSEADLADIVKRAAKIDGIEFEDAALNEIASRSRGTGRVSLRLYRRVRDYHQSNGEGDKITLDEVESALDLLGVDKYGLEEIDRQLLWVMYDHFNGGPVGLSTLGAAISEDVSTISEVYEPFLLKQGLIQRTSRGRVLTAKGLKYVSTEILPNKYKKD